MADGSARWIAKPSITNQATGICIFDRVSQLEAALHANEDLREWVLQRCADDSHLQSPCSAHSHNTLLDGQAVCVS